MTNVRGRNFSKFFYGSIDFGSGQKEKKRNRSDRNGKAQGKTNEKKINRMYEKEVKNCRQFLLVVFS